MKKQEGLYSSLWYVNTPTFFPFLRSFCGNMLLLYYLINMRTKERNNYGRSHIETLLDIIILNTQIFISHSVFPVNL